MYGLLQYTYDSTDPERFERDLYAKDDVILLVHPVTDSIHGFSTLRYLEREVNGELVDCVYSGDTVIDRAYWGQKVLGRAFLMELFKRRLRRPLRPLYWMLISKGYKTYLLMANNFDEHWPRWETTTPTREQAILDALAGELFGSDYHAPTGVVRFAESMGHIKPGLADVTTELVRSRPRVAFFERRNPGWRGGDELVCLAAFPWTLPLRYAWKAIRPRR